MLNKLKKVIFLDIDGTLIDYNYKSNCSEFKLLVDKLQNNGNVFVLNSNRSEEDLLVIVKEFGIDGLLIGENGIFILDQINNSYTYLLKKNELSKLIEQKQKLEEHIKQFGKDKFGSEFFWFDVDTVGLKKENYANLPSNSIVVFNDKYRKYTISAHIKRLIHNQYYIKSLPDLMLIYNAVKNKVGRESNLYYSEIFTNILLTSKLANKRKAVEYVKENIFKHTEFIGIGDELGDFEMIRNIGKFFTINNADKEVKSKAVFVSAKSYTEGVYEILNSYCQ